MNCPNCGSKLYLCKDATTVRDINEYRASTTAYLRQHDHTWVECTKCTNTSDEDEKLADILKELEHYQSFYHITQVKLL